MKIYIKSIKVFFWINFVFSIPLSTLSAKLQEGNLDAIIKNLGAGVNISLFEHYWAEPSGLLKEDISGKLNTIAKCGFKTVRLPVAFDLFLQPNSSNLQPEILSKLASIYHSCIQLKLNLIITYHYGKLNDNNTYSELDRISWIWKQVQNKFMGTGYNNLFFELYNEPTLSIHQWKQTATSLVQYLRYEDKERIYIIGGNNYNNIDAVRDLGNIGDEKVLYTFHFYEPYIFTHQGADWTGDKTYIRDLPYPFKKNRMPDMPSQARGTLVEKEYRLYQTEATKEYLSERIKSIVTFCNNNHMKLICTETGVINLAAKKYRKNYLEDITNILYNQGVPCILWDYDQKFSISKNENKVMNCLKPWLKETEK